VYCWDIAPLSARGIEGFKNNKSFGISTVDYICISMNLNGRP
jgi:hypothetical protein